MSATITMHPSGRPSGNTHAVGHRDLGGRGLEFVASGRTAARRRHRSVSEATYRRRRAIVGILAAVLVAAGMVVAHDVLAGSSGVPASAASSQPAHVRATVTARSGDTLWSIAERHHGAVSLTRYVDTLVDLNGGASIQAGQAVRLP